jgi:tetratricopeptide (TPR) repeat protein|tara:strand:+ start:823 stop:1812 length:990 start_codon:yes stop_codon:yes gene_type:complete
MDIDDFLDKEVQVEKKEEIEDVSSQTAEQSVDDVKDTTSESNETDTVKNYFQLWSKVSEAKFKWDEKLHDELKKQENDVKAEVDKSLLTAGRDKKEIKRLIGKALTELENKNYSAATKLYSEISDMKDKFPDFLLQEKKEINKEIFLLYEKLHDQIDLKFINDFKDSIAHISSLINDSSSSLNMGDIAKAKALYENALKTYKSLPNGLLQEKIGLGNGLLKLYKDLSIQTQIKELQHQLSKGVGGHEYTASENKLRHLSESVKKRGFEPHPQGMQNKALFSNLVARKLDRAKTSLSRGLYSEAKKNIESILNVDPNNMEAKQMLNSLPQ